MLASKRVWPAGVMGGAVSLMLRNPRKRQTPDMSRERSADCAAAPAGEDSTHTVTSAMPSFAE